MIKLYGVTFSNYYNIVKTVLLEKGIAFEEVNTRPSQEDDYLSRSPMGKIPCISTAEGFLSETRAIIEYLEDLGEGPALFPSVAFQRAKVRELIACIELYIELPARRLYREVFFGQAPGNEDRQLIRQQLEKGFAALGRLASFDPYLHGSGITLADFYFRFAVSPPLQVCKKALDWDAIDEVPHVRELLDLLDQRPSVQKVVAEQSPPPA